MANGQPTWKYMPEKVGDINKLCAIKIKKTLK